MRNRSAGYGVGNVLVLLVIIATVWLGISWAIGYFGVAKAQKILTETVVQHRTEGDDILLKEALVQDLKVKGPLEVKPEDIQIFRADKTIKVSLKFIHRAKIPFTEYGIDLPFTAEIEQRTDIHSGF